jgi:hypothetical protein
MQFRSSIFRRNGSTSDVQAAAAGAVTITLAPGSAVDQMPWVKTYSVLKTISGNYSVLRLFAGLAIAALIAWKLTVISVINKAPNAATPKIHNESCIRY